MEFRPALPGFVKPSGAGKRKAQNPVKQIMSAYTTTDQTLSGPLDLSIRQHNQQPSDTTETKPSSGKKVILSVPQYRKVSTSPATVMLTAASACSPTSGSFVSAAGGVTALTDRVVTSASTTDSYNEAASLAGEVKKEDGDGVPKEDHKPGTVLIWQTHPFSFSNGQVIGANGLAAACHPTLVMKALTASDLGGPRLDKNCNELRLAPTTLIESLLHPQSLLALQEQIQQASSLLFQAKPEIGPQGAWTSRQTATVSSSSGSGSDCTGTPVAPVCGGGGSGRVSMSPDSSVGSDRPGQGDNGPIESGADDRKKVHKCDHPGCDKVYTKSSHLKAHKR